MKRGNYTDNPCWYVSVKDAERTALLLGPFSNEPACRKWAYRSADDGGDFSCFVKISRLCNKIDPKSHFYSYGMVKMENGYREGMLNSKIEGNGFLDFHGGELREEIKIPN